LKSYENKQTNNACKEYTTAAELYLLQVKLLRLTLHRPIKSLAIASKSIVQPQTIQKLYRWRSSVSVTLIILFMYYMYLGTGWHWQITCIVAIC